MTDRARIPWVVATVVTPAVEARGPKYLSLGPLRYDAAKGELWEGETHIRLTGSEQTLMRRLAETPGEAVDRPTLIEVLGRDPDEGGENSERAIDVQMTRLRRKIERDPREPRSSSGFSTTVRVP